MGGSMGQRGRRQAEFVQDFAVYGHSARRRSLRCIAGEVSNQHRLGAPGEGKPPCRGFVSRGSEVSGQGGRRPIAGGGGRLIGGAFTRRQEPTSGGCEAIQGGIIASGERSNGFHQPQQLQPGASMFDCPIHLGE